MGVFTAGVIQNHPLGWFHFMGGFTLRGSFMKLLSMEGSYVGRYFILLHYASELHPVFSLIVVLFWKGTKFNCVIIGYKMFTL